MKKADLLIRRYLDNLYTKQEAFKLMNEIHSSKHDNALKTFASDVWEESALQQTCTDLEREQYKKEACRILQRVEHRKRIWFCRVATYVAGTAAIVCLLWGSVKYWNYADEQSVFYIEAFTSYGERKHICLPDGTQLVLNSCSRIRYPNYFTQKERRVELEGEGYFRVQHNKKQPFIVDTQRFDVRVLGTCFNVKSYFSDEIVYVEVESGKVQVDLPEAMMRLQAQERVLVNTVSGDYSKGRDGHSVALWRKGSLRFSSTPVRDVAKELERMYNCRITFAEGQEFNNLISGEHDNKNLEAVLQSIEYTSGIRYKKEGNQVLLYK